jgi:hypothetical protein
MKQDGVDAKHVEHAGQERLLENEEENTQEPAASKNFGGC